MRILIEWQAVIPKTITSFPKMDIVYFYKLKKKRKQIK